MQDLSILERQVSMLIRLLDANVINVAEARTYLNSHTPFLMKGSSVSGYKHKNQKPVEKDIPQNEEPAKKKVVRPPKSTEEKTND